MSVRNTEWEIYLSSEGNYLGEADVWERLESGEWRCCAWDDANGREWVTNGREELLVLMPVSREELPNWAEVTRGDDGVRVVGRRINRGSARAPHTRR